MNEHTAILGYVNWFVSFETHRISFATFRRQVPGGVRAANIEHGASQHMFIESVPCELWIECWTSMVSSTSCRAESRSDTSVSQSNNGCHNPVAAFDRDVIERETGDLGSWLGSSCVVAPNDCPHQEIELLIGRSSKV